MSEMLQEYQSQNYFKSSLVSFLFFLPVDQLTNLDETF